MRHSGRYPLKHVKYALSLQTVSWSDGVEIDNGIVGTPTISCGTDVISFWVKTRNPFKGKVYVKGEYGKSECTTNFANMTEPIILTTLGPGVTQNHGSDATRSPHGPPGTCPPCPACAEDDGSQTAGILSSVPTTRRTYEAEPTTFYFQRRHKRQVVEDVQHDPEMAHLAVKLGTCNIKRDRTLSPPGVQVSFTVVVSFHEHFVTKVDRAYQIQCAYMESDKTVTSQIDVSMPQTTEITAMASMPQCEYSIRRESPEGPAIRYAKVGDAVYHRWECKSQLPEMFGMLVHDCVVSDGQGQQENVIDAKGCSLDAFVVPNLSYEASLLAYVEAHVFKFADRAILDFQCAMTICVKQDGGCEGITPPVCERAAQRRNRREMLQEMVNKTLNNVVVDEENQWRLHAQRLTVVDLDENIKSDELETFEEQQSAALQSASDQHTYVDGSGRLQYYRRIMESIGPRVCLSVAGFGVLVASCTFVFTVAAVIFGALYMLRYQRK
uniref:ZP domain-containing protein n=1 Tax=Plectus sambesii TaxID=2011161 RepID=A0A914WFR1_9BILA